MGTPGSSKKLVDFVLGHGIELPSVDEDAFCAIVEHALGNIAFMFKEVSAPTLGNNGLVLFWPEELVQYQGLRVFDLHQIFRTDDTVVYFVAEPDRIIRVRAVPTTMRPRFVAQDCDEISRGELYRELVESGDGDPLMTILASVRMLIFMLRNRVQKTERKLTKRLARADRMSDRYRDAYSTP